MKLNELRKINTSAYTYVVKLKSLLDGIEFENIMRGAAAMPLFVKIIHLVLAAL